MLLADLARDWKDLTSIYNRQSPIFNGPSPKHQRLLSQSTSTTTTIPPLLLAKILLTSPSRFIKTSLRSIEEGHLFAWIIVVLPLRELVFSINGHRRERSIDPPRTLGTPTRFAPLNLWPASREPLTRSPRDWMDLTSICNRQSSIFNVTRLSRQEIGPI